MKYLSRSEAETKRQKAIDFLRRIGKDDDASRFQAMSPEEYASHKGAQLLANPLRRRTEMARDMGPTKGELADTLEHVVDLAEEALDPELTREELVAKVKELANVAAGESEEEEGEDEEAEDVDADEEDDDGGEDLD